VSTDAPTPEPLREPGYGTFVSRPRDDERATRKPLGLWDRSKFLVLLVAMFFFFVWAEMADDPLLPFSEAVRMVERAKWWLFALAAIEAVRQLHFLVAERSARYHRLWSSGVFERVNRGTDAVDPWTRFRLARVVKAVVVVVVAAFALGAIFDVPPGIALFELPKRVYTALPLIFQLAFGFLFVMVQFVGLFWFLSRGGIDVYYPDDVKTRFTDVWGQDAVVERVKENLVFLEDPESIEAKGGYVPGGILLWGPPGTGKTLMAEAVAGETGKPYVFVDPGAFINMFMGVGILKVKSLFRKLRRLALRYGGVIVFFDEADSLGNRGQLTPGPLGGGYAIGATRRPAGADPFHGLEWLSPPTAGLLARLRMTGADGTDEEPARERFVMGGLGGGGGGGTLQALLAELSGLKKPRGFVNRYVRRLLGMRPKPPPKYRILVMMATNMPQALDEALLRPGRIDRIYKVGYPSKEGRIRTYRGYLDKVPHELGDDDVDRLATITPYATGATIKDLVNEALINAIRAGRDSIVWADVVKAKQLKDLGPPEDVEYILRERHAVAIHEACHAVAAYRIRHHLTIDMATIEKGGNYLGMVASIPVEDQFTRWKSEYEADIVVSLASLAGEKLFFDGDNSSGVSGDLESATQLATLMEGYWGMGRTVASHGVTHRVGIGGGGKPGRGKGDDDAERDLLQGSLGERIEENLAAMLIRAEELLARHRREVLAVAYALESNKTVTGDDIEAIIEGRPGLLLDGRPFHDDAFQADLEAYHDAAKSAHRAHSAPDVALPQLPAAAAAAAGLDAIPPAASNGQGAVEPDPDPA
jgi:cell division protease FtsH